jgi:hypothetical protein
VERRIWGVANAASHIFFSKSKSQKYPGGKFSINRRYYLAYNEDTSSERSIFMHPFLKNLQQQATENPMLAIAAGGATLAGAAKFIGAIVGARNSRVWAKEVSRRAMKDAMKM